VIGEDGRIARADAKVDAKTYPKDVLESL